MYEMNNLNIDGLLCISVSDDEEIDDSVKPKFYDPDLDDKDEVWVQKRRKGRSSDAVLSCPACFTTLCLESQRYDLYNWSNVFLRVLSLNRTVVLCTVSLFFHEKRIFIYFSFFLFWGAQNKRYKEPF